MSKTNYPYYVPVKMEGGILKKIFANSKFDTASQAINEMKHKYKAMERFSGHDHFSCSQNAILEYTGEYFCQIAIIFTNGQEVTIIEPLNK